jgi:hypothetical protein
LELDAELRVRRVLGLSPAAMVGEPRPGDRIDAVDGVSVTSWTADAVSRALSGPTGSTVVVSYFAAASNSRSDVVLFRAARPAATPATGVGPDLCPGGAGFRAATLLDEPGLRAGVNGPRPGPKPGEGARANGSKSSGGSVAEGKGGAPGEGDAAAGGTCAEDEAGARGATGGRNGPAKQPRAATTTAATGKAGPDEAGGGAVLLARRGLSCAAAAAVAEILRRGCETCHRTAGSSQWAFRTIRTSGSIRP